METPANNHRQSQWSLSNDELFELFSWLPAKSVVKFSALSKTLASVFSEPLFIRNQSTRSSVADIGFFLQPDSSTSCLAALELHPPPFLPPAAFGVPPESLEFMARMGRVVAASGGLVLVQKTDVENSDEGEFLICNPVTRKWAMIENPKMENVVRHADSGAMVACGARKGEIGTRVCYIVVPVLVEDDKDAWTTSYRLAVFSDGKWEEEARALKVEGRELRLDMPVGAFRGYNRGLVVHYLCGSLPDASRRPAYLEPYIVAYDVERRMFSRRIKLPEGAWKEGDDGEWGSNERLKMFEYPKGDSICLVRTDFDGQITVWVLEDYDGGIWRTVMSKTAAEMGVEEEELGFLFGCCAVDGDRLAVVTRRRVYGYVMAGEEEGKLGVMGEHGCGEASRVKFTPYANTLEPIWGEGTDSCFCIA